MAEFGWGLASIQFGDIAADGGVAATFASWGVNAEDETCQFTTTEPATKDFNSIENDDPELTVVTKGSTKVFEGCLMDVSTATLEKALGGAVATGVWSSPDSAEEIEKSIKATTKTGNIITAVRCKVVFWITWNFKKEAIAKLHYKATVLKPTKANTPAWSVADPA